MRLIALVCALLMITPLSAEEVYKTKDAAGNVIYSDTPSADAETIQIQEAQTIQADGAPPFEYKPPAPTTTGYTKLVIVSPKNDEALRPEDEEATVQVAARLEPQFRGNDYYVLILDGKEHSAGKSSSFPLTGLDRGSHTVVVKIRDPKGTVLISSDPVTFHILKTSIVPKKAPPPKPPKAP